MMAKKDLEIIKKIKKYCLNINDLKTNFAKDAATFEKTEVYQAAAGMFVMQIGELSNHLSSDFKEKNNSIPWHAIKGMRNVYAHEYHNVDERFVWDTITEDIPHLEKFCDQIINSQEKLNSINEIAEVIVKEIKNTDDLNKVRKNITSKIAGNDAIIKKTKFRTALKQACKNPAIKKIVEKSQDLER